MSNQSFPNAFIWGAATASYQIEGAVQADGRTPSIWDTFSHTPGKVFNGDTGDIACDHYHRWPEDIALMKDLGLDAYRFSIAWPRILPHGTGAVNEAGLRFYDELVDALLAAGITPWVTLYHWDLPQVLEDQGGWPNRATVAAFAEFTDVVTRRLGDRVKHWITLNEPYVFTFVGYMDGVLAPGYQSVQAGFQASHHALLAHGRAMEIIRANVPDAVVGITLNLHKMYPVSDSPADAAAAEQQNAYHNRWFADPVFGKGYPQAILDLLQQKGVTLAIESDDMAQIAAPVDFLGINTYYPVYVAAAPDEPWGTHILTPDELRAAGHQLTEMGWPIVPSAITDLLLDQEAAYHPAALYITENGAACADEVTNGAVHDPVRVQYLHDHIAAIRTAIDQGAPVKGYFAWSLLDNFEWAQGYSKRFGIIYTDYATLTRIPKDSYYWYQKAIAAHGVVPVE